MGSLLVLLIILGCVAYQYLKGTFVKSFIAVITSICAGIVAFGYFELLANVLIEREMLVLWAYPLSFLLLFILAVAGLQTAVVQLTRVPIDFGLLPERIGRVVCGIFLGLIVSGLILTAVSMAPISAKYPYRRFDETNPDPENPGKVFLNADGFATGCFSIVSKGGFSGKRSFAALHPAFLDQNFLNRHKVDSGVLGIAKTGALRIPKKDAVWPAPEGLKDLTGKPIQPKNGYNLTVARIGITYQSVKEQGGFMPAQLRLVCKPENVKNPFSGKGKNVYPIGYMQTVDQLQIKRLTDIIQLRRSDFSGIIKDMDFAFYVPDGFVPILVEFKQNSIAQLPPPTAAEKAPPPSPFILPPENTEDVEESSEEDTEDTAGTEDTAEGES